MNLFQAIKQFYLKLSTPRVSRLAFFMSLIKTASFIFFILFFSALASAPPQTFKVTNFHKFHQPVDDLSHCHLPHHVLSLSQWSIE